jgi:hypothetical protein
MMRGFPRSDFSVSKGRLFRSHLRRFGDEIGEPILADEKEAPQYFLRIPIQIPDADRGESVTVAISPEAAKKILGRT